jgi:regulator of protease activity HflC (stomatin/prohibitin superfamily)
VTAVEIREITPPREITEAMTRQMSAERSRRAMVIEAEGRRDAAVRIADGARQAAVLEAEGARQATVLRAEGFALALDKIFSVAHNVDAKTMSLQYLEALKSLGASQSTKLLIPMEFTALLKPFLEYGTRSSETGDAGQEREPAQH